MADYHVIRTARLSDRQVLDLIKAFKHKVTLKSATVTLGPRVNIEIVAEHVDDDQITKLYRDRHAIQQAYIVTQDGIIIIFLRGIATNVDRPLGDREASPYFDEVALNVHDRRQGPGIWNQVVECIDIIEEILPEFFPVQGVDRVHSAVDILQAQMTTLADQYKEMLGDLEKERVAFRKDFDDRRQVMAREREAEKEQMESEAKKRIEQFELYRVQETQSLQKRASELEKKEQNLDNRQHMHARRDLRRQINR